MSLDSFLTLLLQTAPSLVAASLLIKMLVDAAKDKGWVVGRQQADLLSLGLNFVLYVSLLVAKALGAETQFIDAVNRFAHVLTLPGAIAVLGAVVPIIGGFGLTKLVHEAIKAVQTGWAWLKAKLEN